MIFDYVRFKIEELRDLLIINLVLALLFSLTFARFSFEQISFFRVFVSFFSFLIILFMLRLLFMKYIAYRNGFELSLKLTYFDRYHLRNYDKLSYTTDSAQKFVGLKEIKKIKGIPMPVMGIILYILTLGLLIFPSYWIYDKKKIQHRHLGVKKFYESQAFFNITDYRYAKVLFAGFLFYFIFGLFLKAFYSLIGASFYNGFIFALYWIAFFTIIPILGTEGYELFTRHWFMWINVLTILILGMVALLVFESIEYILIVTAVSFVMVFIVIVYKELMK
ncbi:MAG: hypothetical protein PF569_06215 [Candidatus Woesearchaeota archaeon]|jgi:hypothetical protein|nr:hypothetical protein [Candidatus Woesearchaeota archaeon]